MALLINGDDFVMDSQSTPYHANAVDIEAWIDQLSEQLISAELGEFILLVSFEEVTPSL